MNRNIRVGLIVNTQGLKGEVRVYPLTDYKERFEELNHVYLEGISSTELRIENVRYKNDLVILKFKDINNINDVEKYKNHYLYINEENLRTLPENSYYIIDLLGCNVFDDENTYLGDIIDVYQNTAQDIYVVKLNQEIDSKKDTLLIPAVSEFIRMIDIEQKLVKVSLIEGMLE